MDKDKMNIQEIKINKFPCVIFSDSHCNLSNIKKLKELYPDLQLICLGDIVFLWAKKGEKFNSQSIQYFIDNKIPACCGNHDVFLAWEDWDNTRYDLSSAHLNYLRNLPYGFKLILFNGKNYLLFHNKPQDLWGIDNMPLNEKQFLNTYKLIDKNCLGVLRGHYHVSSVVKYNICPLITIGRLSKDGYYGIINQDGFNFHQL
jgi:predicted phosphodiesterase